MSKHNRTEVLKVLKQQMEATPDLKEKAEIAKQIAKLLPRPRQARRPRRDTQPPIKANNGTSPLVAKWADRLAHVQPETSRIFQTIICEVEERRKKPGCAEVRVVLEEVMGMLSAEERGIVNTGSADAV